jgi:lysozyme
VSFWIKATMKSRKQQASRAALDLIKRFEGYRRAAARLPDGRWTIGYGHTKTARPGAEVSEADAEALLIYDLMEVSGAIHDAVYTPLTQNQFDALAAFVFNVGIENFRHSAVLRRLNEGALLQAAYALELWRRADFEGESIVVDALVRRRAAEKVLFLTPAGGFVPAPTQILKPAFDPEAYDRAPADAVEVEASLEGEEVRAGRVAPAPPAEPEPYEPPSAAQAAAAALAARLDAILEAEPPAAPEEGHAEDLAVPPAPPPEPEELAAGPEADEPGLFAPIPGTPETLAPPEPGLEGATSERRPAGGLTGAPAMLGLGGAGLVLFVAGLSWIFRVKRPAAEGLFAGPWTAGLAVGLLGIACMAVAIYFLLDRLGGRGED